MSWDYIDFPCNPVAHERYKTSWKNTIISNYNYRVDPNIGKGVCDIHQITCACQSCVDHIDNDMIIYCDPSTQTDYDHVDNFQYNNVLEHYNDWTIMEFLDNNKTKEELYNINELVLTLM